MRVAYRAILILLVAFWGATALAQGAAQPGGGAEAQIKALDEQSRQAALQNDISFYEKYLAPNYLGVNLQGQELNREQSIEARKSGAAKTETIDVHDTKIRLYGNTAIVNHTAFVKGTANGHPFSGEARGIFVWVKQGGTWKLVSFSSVLVQGGTKSAPGK
jgi:hypothetical protein